VVKWAISAAVLAALALATAAQSGNGIRMRTYPLCNSGCPGDRTPRWSADGSQIAFRRLSSGTHLVPATGGSVMSLGFDDSPLSWSPDSSRLLFGGLGLLRIRYLDGRPFVDLPGGGIEQSWSADGNVLAVARQGYGPSRFDYVGDPWCCQIVLLNTDGSGSRVFDGSKGEAEWYASPVWASDGRLAFLSGPAKQKSLDRPAPDVWVANADGSRRRRLTTDGNEVPHQIVGWSQDGHTLYFTSDRTFYSAVESIDADGANRREHANLFTNTARLMRLSPDATKVAYLDAGADGTPELRVVPLEGDERPSRWLADGVSTQGRPQLTDFSWSPDSTSIAYTSDGECPTQVGIYVVGIVEATPRRLTEGCRIRGTPHADRLLGSERVNGIYGLEGNDRIAAFGASDFLQGGPGNDRLYGGRGDDRLHGGRGRDVLLGGSGWDAIYARDGEADHIYCGDGRDQVRADRLDLIAHDCEIVERA
jgi:Tol biopolymer transport system component